MITPKISFSASESERKINGKKLDYIRNVRISDSNGGVAVEWNDGKVDIFSNVWLRDHCECSICMHPVTFQRQVDTLEIPLDIVPANLYIVSNELYIAWKCNSLDVNGHQSKYSANFLKYKGVLKRRTIKHVLWGREIANTIPEIPYEEVMKDERGVWKWLNLINIYGFSIVRGVPPNVEDTKELVKRISYIRETIYGGYWDFTADMSMSDTAYTNLELKPHNDGCYFSDPPGLQCFHLLEFNGTGGESILVDGFRVAKELQTLHPESFEFLVKTAIPFHYIDENHYLRHSRTIIELDDSGEPIRFTFNNDDRAPFNFPPEKTQLFYQSLHHLLAILRNPLNAIQFSMKPGNLVTIDNWRVLHGRNAFTGHRRLTGCYLNREDLENRMENLSKKLFFEKEL